MSSPDTSPITEHLRAVQQRYPAVDGLMLVETGGRVLASTFQKDDSIARLGALARTLFLLASDSSAEMGHGPAEAVHIRYRRGGAGDDNAPSQVILRPINEHTLLVIVLSSQAAMPAPRFHHDLERMIRFIAHGIQHNR